MEYINVYSIAVDGSAVERNFMLHTFLCGCEASVLPGATLSRRNTGGFFYSELGYPNALCCPADDMATLKANAGIAVYY